MRVNQTGFGCLEAAAKKIKLSLIFQKKYLFLMMRRRYTHFWITKGSFDNRVRSVNTRGVVNHIS